MVKELKISNLMLCGVFAAMIGIGAFIRIPVPVVPFTLQFLFTTLAGMLLGKRLGTLSVIVYLVIGLAGVPIFAQGGGFSYVMQPTFGYLLGFAAGCWVTGSITEGLKQLSVKGLLVAGFSGLAVVYIIGMAYYYLICNYVLGTPIAFWPLFLYCFLLAVPGDIALCIVSAILSKRILPAVKGFVK